MDSPVQVDLNFLDATLALEEVDVAAKQTDGEAVRFFALWRRLHARFESRDDPSIP